MSTAESRSTSKVARPTRDSDAVEGTVQILELLARHDLVVVPHIAARIGLAVAGDAEAVLETARALRPSQRLGRTALPDPLPVVPAIARALDGQAGELADWERRVLLTAAVSVGDRTDVLLAAADCSIADLLDGQVSRHLLLVAGHFTFADPRMRIWVHGRATLAERTDVHAALAAAHHEIGDGDDAVWHRALSTLEGDPQLVEPLLAIAAAADAIGEPERAHAVAREAASHARGRARGAALCLTGIAALHLGIVDEAVERLAEALDSDDPAVELPALPAFVHAVGIATGQVPDDALDLRLHAAAQTDSVDRLRALAHAVAIAACLHAEWGEAVAARRRLADLARLVRAADAVGAVGGARTGGPTDAASAALGSAGTAWSSARGWCAVFGISPDPSDDLGPMPADGRPLAEVRTLTESLELAFAGETDAALRRLRDRLGSERDGDVRSPLARACREVVAAVVRLWAGAVDCAAEGLARAAADLPVGLAFGGFGAALARRLDLLADGTVGVLAAAIDDANPASGSVPRRVAEQVDRALIAFVDGRPIEARALLALAGERRRSIDGGILYLTDVDEVAGAEPGVAGVERLPADAVAARVARARIRRVVSAGSATELTGLAEEVRAIASPYERGRAELLLGEACVAAGATGAALRHLVLAEGLFRESGVGPWQRIVTRRLHELPREPAPAAAGPQPVRQSSTRPDGSGASAAPGAGPAPLEAAEASDPLRRCRERWADLLTERELEVAMLVARGASNREAAGELFVSVRTVEVHVGRVFTKLGVHSRVELAVLAHRGTPAGIHGAAPRT
ncbi:helix-turn-helix transcriptional regulator [Agromyces sp. LHK192]|uniref:helix-turn-helix transcriptional regulator n=1 Tax=Agromyces sp. LHK192 TaxID=2498704 RepID=UPI000FD87C16|nr:helix-turn-helix transcriptional regulator [Agromyces sp. LHK192]